MRHARTISLLTPILVGLTFSVLWTGCTPVEVDEVDNVSSVYEDLAQATTERQARQAISKALYAAGIDDPYHEPTGATFSMKARGIENLARSLVEYNTGAVTERAFSFRQAFERTQRLPGGEIKPASISAERALEIMQHVIVRSFELETESRLGFSPISLPYLAASHGAPPSSEDAMSLSLDAEISPVQAFAFGMWINMHGGGLANYPGRLEDIGQDHIQKAMVDIWLCIDGSDFLLDYQDPEGDEGFCLNFCATAGETLFCTPQPNEASCLLNACTTDDPTTGCNNDYEVCLFGVTPPEECDAEYISCVESHGGGGPVT